MPSSQRPRRTRRPTATAGKRQHFKDHVLRGKHTVKKVYLWLGGPIGKSNARNGGEDLIHRVGRASGLERIHPQTPTSRVRGAAIHSLT